VTLELQKVLALAIDLPQDYKETGIGPERDSTGSRLGRNQKQALTNRLVKGRRGQDAARGIEPRRVDNTLNRMRRKGFGHSKKKKKKKMLQGDPPSSILTSLINVELIIIIVIKPLELPEVRKGRESWSIEARDLGKGLCSHTFAPFHRPQRHQVVIVLLPFAQRIR